MNETHDPALRSWLDTTGSDFPIQNLPLGIFRRPGEQPRGGVAIGDQIVDLPRAARLFTGAAATAASACERPSLNDYLALGPASWSALRMSLSRALRTGASQELSTCLVPQQEAELLLPIEVGDYTDFYASIHHATRVGKLFRPDQPLMPNYSWLPVAYHGRSSSVVVSGTPVKRPRGQIKRPDAPPSVHASARLDYEVELGVVVGVGNPLGSSISIEHAESHLYGLCLLNDWSARDIQGWEYQPLGPFGGKNFATTISPWLVSLEALEPYRASLQHPAELLPYLDSAQTRARGAFDVQVEAHLVTARMRREGLPPQRLSRASFRSAAYWTIAQMLTHHTVNGCPMRAGDLLGTGTLSGEPLEQAGCLLELSEGGKQPLTLDNGEARTFLQDGDQLILRAFCEQPGAARIGFGSATGVVLAAEE
jgi:fumarylacetoacetase